DIGAFEYGSTKSTSVVTETPKYNTSENTPMDTKTNEYDTDEITAVEIKNNPVNKPAINGKINGRPGRENVYKFVSTDPDADDVTYCINWGDGTKEVRIGPTQSGVEAYATHTWFKKGNYIIKAKAIDAYGAESDWATFKVSISKAHINNPINHLFFSIAGIFSFYLKKY
ncbi:MAG: PKD domain-containing protein, partial [Candidatus Thermoplasmatota archaeon]|nr:PKD domain-containing protein [Candidatus Thermoplasmatota archaeon]